MKDRSKIKTSSLFCLLFFKLIYLNNVDVQGGFWELETSPDPNWTIYSRRQVLRNGIWPDPRIALTKTGNGRSFPWHYGTEVCRSYLIYVGKKMVCKTRSPFHCERMCHQERHVRRSEGGSTEDEICTALKAGEGSFKCFYLRFSVLERRQDCKGTALS